ncbi:MAG: lipoate--protein ligase family protein [Acidobacteria bacterium]|nr:lipoate--protein ligase family protein [Acidobacteriota bacterium]
MRLIENGPPDARWNVAFDAALFHELEGGAARETLRFWESTEPAVILGSFGPAWREIDEEACAADRVPVVRRTSGGGAVVVGRGCLNYSLLMSLDARPELRHVAHSYDVILGRMAAALGVPGLTVEAVSDLALDGRKVAGSAQRRGRRALLHHGTVLYAFDASVMTRYLKDPARQPSYRAGRPHTEFVTNLPMGLAAIRAALMRSFLVRSDIAQAGRARRGASPVGRRPHARVQERRPQC